MNPRSPGAGLVVHDSCQRAAQLRDNQRLSETCCQARSSQTDPADCMTLSKSPSQCGKAEEARCCDRSLLEALPGAGGCVSREEGRDPVWLHAMPSCRAADSRAAMPSESSCVAWKIPRRGPVATFATEMPRPSDRLGRRRERRRLCCCFHHRFSRMFLAVDRQQPPLSLF